MTGKLIDVGSRVRLITEAGWVGTVTATYGPGYDYPYRVQWDDVNDGYHVWGAYGYLYQANEIVSVD